MSNVKVTKEVLSSTAIMAIKMFIEKLAVTSDPIIDLVLKKNADYGDAWQRFDIFTPLVRINDKLLRVEKLSDGREALVPGEKIEDTLVDTVGYALLGLLKMRSKGLWDEQPVTILSSVEQRIVDLPEVEEDNYEPTQEDLDWIASQEDISER